jgi:DNA-binding SARP family transcriptional activator/Tfp pilus assembly protein PilF
MVDLLALGPLELWHEGKPRSLGATKVRCVLATLLYAAGEQVSAETLVDRLWDEDAELPEDPAGAVQTYVSRLRKHLRPFRELASIDRPSPRSYRLNVAADHVDLFRFRRLRTDASAAVARGERDLAIRLLREAESLWRGEPFAEFNGEWAASARTRLQVERRGIREERIKLALDAGHHAEVIGELWELVAQDPMAKRRVALLMTALYRDGHDAEALELYRRTHSRYSETLGVEPGEELEELHRRILARDPALDGPAGEAPSSVQPYGGANHLPPDTYDFTGRSGELRALLGASASDGADDAQRTHQRRDLPVVVVHGMPGVGKTVMAIRAGYALSEHYPDGQFLLNLRGYSDQPPQDPEEAIAELLRYTGWSGELPPSLDERAARWRAWAARHRALIVLDDARTARQVSPLLPGTPHCRTIVTSRNLLTGLEGARHLPLDVLSTGEAMELFTRIAGSARTGDTGALRRVVDACDRHPLALRLLASRYQHRSSWDLDHLLERLDQAPDSLDEFDDKLALAFQLSYSELDARTRQLFRRLSLHPGPDITLAAAAALSGVPPTAGLGRLVDELTDFHLLEEVGPDRYRMHDLLRAFGRQVCHRDECPEARKEAVRRLLTHYLATADRADRLAHPHRRRLPAEPADGSPPGSGPAYAVSLADAEGAVAWLEVERANLTAAARAAMAGYPDLAAHLPHVLAPTLTRWGAWDLASELHEGAVSALRGTGRLLALAQALTEWADVLGQEDPEESLQHATEAQRIFEELGDAEGDAAARLQIGRAHLGAGRNADALRVLDPALRAFRATGNRKGEADVLNVFGVALHYRGDYTEARKRFGSMLAIAEELGSPPAMVKALTNMGDLLVQQDRHTEAREHFERALVLARRYGGLHDQTILDGNIGDVLHATGQLDRAVASFRRALEGYRAGGDSSGEAHVLVSLGHTYADAGRMREAQLHFSKAEAVAEAIGNSYERQRALIGIGDTQRAAGRFGAARATYEEALRVARRSSYSLGAAAALTGLARIAVSVPMERSARDYGEQALALYERLGARKEAAGLRRLLEEWSATGS